MMLKTHLRGVKSALMSGPIGWRESLYHVARRKERDPGIGCVVWSCATWLLQAQENSGSRDGGVSSHYCLKHGWANSYPETTGYIIPTLLAVAASDGREECRSAALRMLEWLRSIQLGDGSFHGGRIDEQPRLPVVFNTGQILFGLVAAVDHWGDANRSMAEAAANWLVDVQDSDGAWRACRSPFTTGGPKAYEAHVAWALLEAERVSPARGYGPAAIRNIRWAVSCQSDNGWFDNCGLGDDAEPSTHAIGYALRGIIEGWRHSRDPGLLESARRSADTIAGLVRADGWLAGTYDRHWNTTANWVCISGSSQLAHCLLLLYADTGAVRYLDAARRLNRFVRSTIQVAGDRNVAGGVKGSFPAFGGYYSLRFPNWAAKFTIDSNLAELELATG